MPLLHTTTFPWASGSWRETRRDQRKTCNGGLKISKWWTTDASIFFFLFTSLPNDKQRQSKNQFQFLFRQKKPVKRKQKKKRKRTAVLSYWNFQPIKNLVYLDSSVLKPVVIRRRRQPSGYQRRAFGFDVWKSHCIRQLGYNTD